jgi:hypothetical protein
VLPMEVRRNATTGNSKTARSAMRHARARTDVTRAERSQPA